MKKFVFFPFLFFCSFLVAQETFDVNRDIDVIPVFENVVEMGYGTPLIYKELANGYYFRNDYENAKIWFEKLFEEDEPIDETMDYRYHQCLKALGIHSIEDRSDSDGLKK